MGEFMKIIFGAVFALIMVLVATFVFVASLNYIQANGLDKLGYTTKVVAGECYAKVDTRWITCDSATKDLNIKEVK